MKLSRKFSYDFIDVDIFSSSDHIPQHLKSITSLFLLRKMMEGLKLSNFKIVGPISQKNENKVIKTAIKPNKYHLLGKITHA